MMLQMQFFVCALLIVSCAGRSGGKAGEVGEESSCLAFSVRGDGDVVCSPRGEAVGGDGRRRVAKVWRDPFADGVSVMLVQSDQGKGAELVLVDRSVRGGRGMSVAVGGDAQNCVPLENSVKAWWLACELLEFHGGVRSHHVVVRDVRVGEEVELLSVEHTLPWVCGGESGDAVVSVEEVGLVATKRPKGAELRVVVKFREARTVEERVRVCGAVKLDDGPLPQHASLLGAVRTLEVVFVCSDAGCRTRTGSGSASRGWVRVRPPAAVAD